MVKIANQIALHFAGFPREEAIAGIRDHIEKFWEHRMKDQLIHFVAQGRAGLNELVIEAVKRMEIGA